MVKGRGCRGVDGRWVGVAEGQGWKRGRGCSTGSE